MFLKVWRVAGRPKKAEKMQKDAKEINTFNTFNILNFYFGSSILFENLKYGYFLIIPLHYIPLIY